MRHRVVLLSLALALALSGASWGVPTTWYAQAAGDASTLHWDDIHDGGGNNLTWANLGATDVLCANGNTVHADANITCLRISTAAEVGMPDVADGPGAAGGGFTADAAVTITANILAGTTPCLVTSGTAWTLTIVGDVTGGTAANAQGINNATAVTLDITTTSTGVKSGTNSNASYGILNVAAGNITIVGPVTSVSTCGLRNDSTGNIIVTGGNVTGSANNSVYMGAIRNVSTGTITITGSVIAGAGTSSPAIYAGSGQISITSGDIINLASGPAISLSTAVIQYNPGPTNYIQYPSSGAALKYGKTIPAASVLEGVNGDGASAPAVGTLANDNVLEASGGHYHAPTNTEVIHTATFGAHEGTPGIYHAPETSEVRYGAGVGATTGTLTLPHDDTGPPYNENTALALTSCFWGPVGLFSQGTATGGIAVEDIVAAPYVLSTQRRYAPDGPYGTYVVVPASKVRKGTLFGPASSLVGTFVGWPLYGPR